MNKDQKNYYEVLKVSPLASPTAIKKAYRRLARLHHPDKNKGNVEAGELFKQINQAYQTLSDPFKRKAFDHQLKKEKEQAQKKQHSASYMYDSFQGYSGGEKGPSGPFPMGSTTMPPHASPPPPTMADRASSQTHPIGETGSATVNKQAFSFSNLKDQFTRALNTKPVTVPLPISLESAVLGCQKPVTFQTRQKKASTSGLKKGTFMVSVPPGAKEKQIIKINSAFQVSLVYEEHPLFKADGDNITMDLPVPWTKAILGGKVCIPTPRGEVSFQLPAGTPGGHVIQLKGQGFPLAHSKQRGAMLITIVIDIPSDFSPQEKEWISLMQNRKAHCPKVAEFDIKAKLLLKNRKPTD